MLIATPYRSFDVREKSPPRIISEIRKNCGSCIALEPKLTGDLLLRCGNERLWKPRKVSVRGGQLVVAQDNDQEALRVPLRHLSLSAGPLPNSLSLCRGQSVVLTLQACSQFVFDQWVKIIAIELIRQTPLDAIKYLDILTIAEYWKKDASCEADFSFAEAKPEVAENNAKNETELVKVRENGEVKSIEDILKKCQDVESYVPVKDKLFLFESLCKLDRKVRSTEDVSVKLEICTKRTRSMHDLSTIKSHIAVKEMCKYFENRAQTDSTPSKNKKA